MSAEEFKQKGNAALQQKDFNGALEHYSKGLEIEPNNHLLLSNRSAVYLQLKRFNEAYEDSSKAVQAKPDFGKAYLRQGQALYGIGRLEEAITVLEKVNRSDQ
jgi:tetratricopeptide (TPR) repeat protein